MIRYVIKRDGRHVRFESTKVASAIAAAFGAAKERYNEDLIADLTNRVGKQFSTTEVFDLHVERIQDVVEKTLFESGFKTVAQVFNNYRTKRSEMRNGESSLTTTFKQLLKSDSCIADVAKENANINADSTMGTMLKFGSESSKSFAMRELISPKFVMMHRAGDFHIHDLDFYPLTINCCQIDLSKLFKYGFSTGHGFIRPPQSIGTAAALTCIAIQSNQNDMFGGQSIPCFEYYLAPYVAKSFVSELIQLFSDFLHINHVEASGNPFNDIKSSCDRLLAQCGTLLSTSALEALACDIMKLGLLSESSIKELLDIAVQRTDRLTYQAMESLLFNLNTMQSRAGAQTPFSSINYGTGTTAEQRMVIKNILLVTNAGLGNGETSIFPVQVFKIKTGINTNRYDPNYDLFKLACKVTAKRMFPNFSFVDMPANFAYYKKGQPETEIAVMGCSDEESVITVKSSNNKLHCLTLGEFVNKPDALTYTVWDSSSNDFIKINNVINNPETSEWLRITFSCGRFIDVTPDHRFDIVGKGILHANEVSIGDCVLNGKVPSNSVVTEFKNSVDYYWLLGVIIRDACLNKTCIVTSIGHDETDLAERVADVWKESGCDSFIVEWNRGVKGHYYDVKVIGQKALVNKLTNDFGHCRKNYRRIPDYVFSLPRECQFAFLGGMIDADGHIGDKQGICRIQLGTINKAMSLQTFMLTQYLGLNAKIYAAPYGRGKEYLRYSVEIQPTKELCDYIFCEKKALKLKNALKFSKIEIKDNISIIKIESVQVSRKSYCLETESDHFDINGISSCNCRTRVVSNINDTQKQIYSSRGNLFFNTINLPRIAILSNKNMDTFYELLKQMLGDACDQLTERFKYISKRHVYNYPFLMEQGVWMDSEKLEPTDTIGKVIKHGSLSVGFVGLAEALVALIGEHHGQSQTARDLGIEIVSYMRDYLDNKTEQTRLNWSLFASPAESTAGALLRLDRERFGVIPNVTDREYYTNSFAVPVYFPIKASDKIKIEGPYHALCNAGSITYVELNGDLVKNVEAVEKIVLYMRDCGVSYGAINHPIDRCPVCGFMGVINSTCPKCGRTDGQGVSVDKLKSLGIKFINEAPLA